MITDKKALAEFKRKHDLHVLLFMERHKVTKAVAVVQVYAAGIDGLAKLLGQPEPLVNEAAKK